MKRKCYVIGAGEIYDNHLPDMTDGYVIAVDGGYEYASASGIKADLVIGDFDSADEIPLHPNIIHLEREKDDTDMLAALKEGLLLDCNEFHIFGGTGGRIAHTLANVECLAYLAAMSTQGFLYENKSVITAIANGSMSFGREYSGYISVFSHTSQAVDVNLTGLKYELKHATITNTFPVGISNEFTGKESTISVKDGILVIVYGQSKD